MEPLKAIKLLEIAEREKRKAAHPTFVAPIDECIAQLAFFSGIDLNQFGSEENFDSILEAVFGQSQRIRDVCLNPSRFWEFAIRFAYLASKASESKDLVETTIQSLRNDYNDRHLGQQRFLQGIADSTSIVALTANGYLLWDSMEQKIRLCPLHWEESELRLNYTN